MSDTATLCLWSGPRNVSTALMYSFAQRSDTIVVDEPLYGHYLRVTEANHPGKADVLQSMNCNGNQVVRDLIEATLPRGKALLFAKHMAHHLVDLDQSFLAKTTNILLIRDPGQMLPSLIVQLPDAGLADTGLATQWRLFEKLAADGRAPLVMDARLLLLDPASVLTQLCTKLGIGFDAGMLKWPEGARAEDGIWAKHWYHAVHRSQGFQPYRHKHNFPRALEALREECQPYYDRLLQHAIRPRGEPK